MRIACTRICVLPAMLAAIAFAAPVSAELSYKITGVGDKLESNIIAFVDTVQLGGEVRLSERDYDSVVAKAVANTRRALRPFGYYAPVISGRIARDQARGHVLVLDVNPGPPIVVSSLDLNVVGEGSSLEEVRIWRTQWPLNVGKILDQTLWEQNKQEILESIEAIGFLAAKFSAHTLNINLDKNTADLVLLLDTGPQFYMGAIDYGEHVLKPGILEYVARFSKGAIYTSRRMDHFRGDLWKTGYFTDIEVEEVIRPDATPPTVDLLVRTKTETRNSYQGALGVGTDTGVRLQADWSRHPMSASGDRLDVGIGWQELNDEYGIRAVYRKPRRARAREFWTTDLTIKFENVDLDFKIDDEDENFITVANGDIAEQNLKFGRLKIKNFKSGDQQLFTTPFVQYLNSNRSYQPVETEPPGTNPLLSPEFDQQFNRVDQAISLGIDADLVLISGKGFDTRGHRERASVFTSLKEFGSEISFTQLYFSTRRSYVASDRWKFLLRAEVGYTDAEVNGFTIDTESGALELSVTRLPNFYRFKAGGSQSVRGYAFEQLSNNNVGSNNVITASAEVEMRFLPTWSAALFVDIGNAFNDWSNPELKTGVGVGVRWYSIAGPIRVDVAQALDFTDKPWRVHFTIGTPLL